MRQLNDRTNYGLLDSDSTDTFSQQIQHTLDDMHVREVITDKAYEFLSPIDCKPAWFYHQPKLHTESIPGRPIVIGNGSPTENISLFVDNFIKPLVSQAPSYIHDTPDFLRKLEAVKNKIPSTAIIGTFDVSSLYTHIPHDEGVLVCCEALAESNHTSPPIDDLKALMYHVLTKNNFTFMDNGYLQIFGNSMGWVLGWLLHLHAFSCLDLNNRCWTLLPVVRGYGGASSTMYSSYGPVMKRVFILLSTTSILSTEPSNKPQKFLINRSTSWMCLSARSMTLWSLTFTPSLQILTSTFTLPVAIPVTVRMVLLTAKLTDFVAFVLMTLISLIVHIT